MAVTVPPSLSVLTVVQGVGPGSVVAMERQQLQRDRGSLSRVPSAAARCADWMRTWTEDTSESNSITPRRANALVSRCLRCRGAAPRRDGLSGSLTTNESVALRFWPFR
jgi:hypothetical protein